jgi:site-specific DNA-methyltransferase (adenine-specific)
VLASLAGGPLDYVWTFCLTSSAARANGIQFLKVQNVWKPVVLLRKGNQPLLEWTADRIDYEWEENSRVVQLHRWQQEVSPLQKLIHVMTAPGGLVADPFCGSGTTGVAALGSDRHFIGCDIDEQATETTIERLTNYRTAAEHVA